MLILGGMDIEAVAATNPDAIIRHPVDLKKGLSLSEAQAFATKLGFEENAKEAADLFVKLYGLFIKTDATMIEINPLAETQDRKVLNINQLIYS
jgi:succinyl-CoA synthetase beta subunit